MPQDDYVLIMITSQKAISFTTKNNYLLYILSIYILNIKIFSIELTVGNRQFRSYSILFDFMLFYGIKSINVSMFDVNRDIKFLNSYFKPFKRGKKCFLLFLQS